MASLEALKSIVKPPKLLILCSTITQKNKRSLHIVCKSLFGKLPCMHTLFEQILITVWKHPTFQNTFSPAYSSRHLKVQPFCTDKGKSLINLSCPASGTRWSPLTCVCYKTACTVRSTVHVWTVLSGHTPNPPSHTIMNPLRLCCRHNSRACCCTNWSGPTLPQLANVQEWAVEGMASRRVWVKHSVS